MRKLLASAILFSCCIANKGFAQKLGCSAPEINPLNNQSVHKHTLDTTKSRGMADNYYLWDNGVTLKVKFLTGSPAFQEKIKKIAKEWEQYANVKFNFVASGDADIRVRLSEDEGHWSYLGSYARGIHPSEHTLCMDTSDLTTSLALKRVVLHEFGHAIGLLHEHFSPVSGIKWNKEKLYADYAKTQGWSRAEVDAQVFRTYHASYTNGTAYDNKSIMHYPIKKYETINGYSVGSNYNLSEGDKKLIAALYPKSGERKNEVTRANIINYTKLEVKKNDKKGGLSIFPKFDLVTSGKSGNVYFIVSFYDSEGYPLISDDDNYHYNYQVAAFRKVFAVAGQKTRYNHKKRKKKRFEIFIPYNQIEGVANNTKVYLKFHALLGTEIGEFKDIYQGSPINYSFSK